MFRPGRDKGIATPIPLGLAALATTTFLMGFAFLFQGPAHWGTYFLQAALVGGVAEFLAGMWSFAYGDALAATTFSFVGVFCVWWAINGMGIGLALTGVGHSAVTIAALTSPLSTGMVFIATGVVVGYIWIASFKESVAFNLAMLFLGAFYILAGIFAFTGAFVLGIISGVCAIISGLIAGYASFAELYNAASLSDTVPLGEPSEMRMRSEQEEMDRIRRIHGDRIANGTSYQAPSAGVATPHV
jgi:uncharacterized protein